jgi:hypothetical protein
MSIDRKREVRAAARKAAEATADLNEDLIARIRRDRDLCQETLTVSPRRREALVALRQAAPTSEDLCDALQMLGWNPLPVADRGAGSLYVDRDGRRLRVHYRSAPL